MSSRVIFPRTVVLAGALVASLLTAAVFVRVGPLYAAVLAVLPLAATVLAADRHRALVAGVALGLAVPAWWTIGTSQAGVSRVAGILALLALIVGQRRSRFGPIDAVLLALVTDVVLSAFLQTAEPRISGVALIFVLPLIFYFAASALPVNRQRQVVSVAVTAITLGALTVILERLAGHTLFQDPKSYSWVPSNGGIFRPGGIYGSPPEASFALVAGILLAIPLRTATSSRQRIALAASVAVMVLALVLTFERAAMIGLAVGFITYLLLIRRDAGTLLKYSIAIGLLLVVVVVALPSANSNTTFQHGLLRSGANTLAARQSIWQQELPIVTSSLQTEAIGLGFGSTILARAGGSVPEALAFSPDLVSKSIHNQYLLVLLEQGVVGLALFLAFLGSVAWSGVRFAARSRDRLGAGMTASLIALLIESITSTPVLQRSSWMLSLLVMGLLVARMTHEVPPKQPAT